MSDIGVLHALEGRWQGNNRLWLDPTKDPDESLSVMRVTPVLHDTFVQVEYTWAFQGTPHEGIMLIGFKEQGGFFAAWTDTFHLANDIMQLQGLPDAEGTALHGTYRLEGGPDWGWDIAFHPQADGFVFLMFNIWPDGTRAPAVEAHYTRMEP
jgi:hypothetical protein